jgi:transcriptional regulator with XRE-family HTH domain
VEKLYTKEIKEVGLKIKNLRESKALTQQGLADLCEVDIRTIQRIEKGEFGFGLHILFAIAEALGVKPGDLLKDIKL